MKIIVIGKSGQLAWELSQLSSVKHEIVCLGRKDINLNELLSVSETLKTHKAEAIINASAYTAVDKAESDIDNAYELNAKAVGHLAQACKLLSLPFVHISTDFVFHGGAVPPLGLSSSSLEPSNSSRSISAGSIAKVSQFIRIPYLPSSLVDLDLVVSSMSVSPSTCSS